MTRGGEKPAERDLTRGRALLNDASRLTATSLNARILPDGSFGFDDKDKSALFSQRLEFISRLVEQDPSILKKPNAALELHSAAVKALPLKEAPSTTPPVEPKPPAGGKLKAAGDAIADFFNPQPKPAAKPAAKPAEGEAPTKENAAKAINDKAKKVSARTDISDADKAKALTKLRAIAKEQGVKVNF